MSRLKDEVPELLRKSSRGKWTCGYVQAAAYMTRQSPLAGNDLARCTGMRAGVSLERNDPRSIPTLLYG